MGGLIFRPGCYPVGATGGSPPCGRYLLALLTGNSHMAQTNWRPAEDMGYHDQGRPGTDLRTASLRPRTMEKGLGESV